jgi:general secretion pathway protein L
VNLQELLNSEMDLASLAALARRGWAWWIDELIGMAPPAWRAALSSKPRLLAEQTDLGGWRYWRDGHPMAGAPAAKAREAGVAVMLAPSAVLSREITVPRMPAADVRRMLALDIDRLSPLAPDLIHFDVEVVDRDVGEGRQRVLLGITPRAGAARLLASARAEGLEVVALGARIEGETPGMRFDFLPAVLRAAGEKPGGRVRLYWWAAVFALLLANLAVLVGRDMADVARLRAIVDAQAPMTNAVLGLRRRVDTEERWRADFIAQARKAEPLRMLEILTQAVPTGAWVQHLEWNGQTLRLVGFKQPDIDMAAAIRGSGAFTNPRLLAPAGAAPAVPGAQVPFDISADARPAPRP